MIGAGVKFQLIQNNTIEAESTFGDDEANKSYHDNYITT